MVSLSNTANLQTNCEYSIKDDNDVKLSLTHIRKLKNTAKDETLAIEETVLLTKATIDREKLDVSVKKV